MQWFRQTSVKQTLLVLIEVFWHQAENFDTSTAGGAGDKYQVHMRGVGVGAQL